MGHQLDRDAVGRVLRRATQLAGDGSDVPSIVGGIDEQALVEAAAEVGIPTAAVRRALALERLHPRPRPRAGDRIVGAAVVAVDAEVAGSASDVLARLDAWFVDGHHLRRHRVRDGHGEWTKRKGIVGRTVRHVRVATGEGHLGGVQRVCVSTGETGVGTTVVRVEVDRGRERRASAAAGVAVATLATAGTLLLAAVTAPALLVATPVAVLAGIRVAGGGRSRASVVAGEVDRLLDAVDDRVPPIRLRTDVASRVIGRTRHSIV